MVSQGIANTAAQAANFYFSALTGMILQVAAASMKTGQIFVELFPLLRRISKIEI
jgi:hypothetical protein